LFYDVHGLWHLLLALHPQDDAKALFQVPLYQHNLEPSPALHYLRPIDYYRDDPQALLAQRNEKLAAAVEQRAARWKEQLAKTPGV
jgi:hypothetical protein